MFDVITIGSATRDIFLKSKSFEIVKKEGSEQYECIPFGQKVNVEEIEYASGGGGTNAAVTFARHGFRTACASVIGNDRTGEEIIAELKDENVDTGFFVKHEESPSALSVVLVHSSGERSILSYKGEGQHFVIGDIDIASLQAPWFYVDSTGGNIHFLHMLFDAVKKQGARVAWNPGGADIKRRIDELKGLLSRCDIFFTNKEEAEELLGAHGDAQDLLRQLGEYSQGICVITDGRRGAYVRLDNGEMLFSGVPDSPVIDATGAGDAFGSGFVAEYIRSGDVELSIRRGTDNASSVVAHYGAKRGILRFNEDFRKHDIIVSHI